MGKKEKSRRITPERALEMINRMAARNKSQKEIIERLLDGRFSTVNEDLMEDLITAREEVRVLKEKEAAKAFERPSLGLGPSF